MSEELRGGIEAGPATEPVEQDIDPELADDREVADDEIGEVDLPDYDPTQFEFPDDDYVDEEVDE